MAPFAVVEHFHVFEQASSRLVAGFVVTMHYKFSLYSVVGNLDDKNTSETRME